MDRLDRQRLTHLYKLARKGPTEVGYWYLRKRRRLKGRPPGIDLAESDLIALTDLFDLTPEQLARHRRLVVQQLATSELPIRSIQWFLTYFDHALFGGVYTILRFADRLAAEHGVESRFCVCDTADEANGAAVAARIAQAFPRFAGAEVTVARSGGDDFGHLPECDAAFATFWMTAYPLVRFERCRAKYYLCQDFEPAFYPAGSAAALAEESYRFGIPGVVNTPGLAEHYRGYGNRAVSFLPAVDRERFRPPSVPRAADRPARILFYARPSTPRNAFGLGVQALREVHARLGSRVEIMCAGEDWDVPSLTQDGWLQNLGKLSSLDAVAELYRSCDIGLVLMLSKHPSYQPFEWMACGMATVTNRNPSTEWLLRHEHNALVAEPVPSMLAAQVVRLVEDRALRERIVAAASAELGATSWPEEIDRVWTAITHPATLP